MSKNYINAKKNSRQKCHWCEKFWYWYGKPSNGSCSSCMKTKDIKAKEKTYLARQLRKEYQDE